MHSLVPLRFLVSLVLLVTFSPGSNGQTHPSTLTAAGRVAWEASATPARKGIPGQVPFWNEHAKRFIYAPAFDFKSVPNADHYHFELTSDAAKTPFHFDAAEPFADLGPIWTQVPVGEFTLTVTGIAKDGAALGIAGKRSAYRAAPFNGPYHQPPVLPLDESASLALRKLLHKDYVNYWLHHRKPDPEYVLYQYPSKIHGALVIGAVTQARLTAGSEEARRSTELARVIADYMLQIRFPAGSKWQHHVPTYHGPHIKKVKKKHMRLANHLTTMGVDAGNAFLEVYELTGDDKYLLAATQIAETYRTTQNEQGTWPLLVRFKDGESVSELISIPTAVVNYIDRLQRDYQVKGLEEVKRRALHYIMENPVKSFNWQGQFEDIVPRASYVNQSREQACELAMYLLRNKENQELAEELIRFAEDQFVIWEKPLPRERKNPGFSSANWITPSVQEQYVFWNPVGRSAAVMIETYWQAYESTGDTMYRLKAESLANTFPAVQQVHDGDYPTFFTPYPKMNFWLNSVVFPAKVLMELERKRAKLNPSHEQHQSRRLRNAP